MITTSGLSASDLKPTARTNNGEEGRVAGGQTDSRRERQPAGRKSERQLYQPKPCLDSGELISTNADMMINRIGKTPILSQS